MPAMRTVWRAALPLLIAFAGFMPGSEDNDVSLAAMDADVVALAAMRDRCRAQIPAPSRADAKPLTISIPLPGLLSRPNRFGGVDRAHAVFVIRHFDGVTLADPLEGGSWKNRRHLVDASRLEVKPPQVKGALVIHLGENSGDQFTLNLDAAIAGEKLEGAWSTPGLGDHPVQPANGTLQGATVREEPTVSKPFQRTKPSLELSPAQQHYAAMQAFDRASHDLYQEIRAALVARDTRISLPHALELCRVEAPTYPDLPEPATARDDGKNQGPGDSLDGPPIDAPPMASRKPAKRNPGKGKGETAEPPPSETTDQALARHLAAARERIAKRRSLAEALAAGAPVPPIVGSQDPGDPQFGPWYGDQTLPNQDGKANLIPVDAGKPGNQLWLIVGDWLAYGPFVQFPRQAETPSLPEFIPGHDLVLPIDPRLVAGGRKAEASKRNLPARCEFESGPGYLRPPVWCTYQDHGTNRWDYPNSTFFATSTLTSASARELWLGVTVNDHGKLWINDRLVWTSPPGKDPRRMEETYIFRARVDAGANRLLFRCDNDLDHTWFSLRVCVRGEPRSPARIATDQAATDARRAKAGSPVAGITGWRNDWSGRWPDARPPIAWDAERDINVAWRVPMGLGYTTPVIVGGKVFAFEEPDYLLCYDKLTGKELWCRSLSIARVRSPELAAEAERLQAGSRKAHLALLALGKDDSERKAALIKTGLDANTAYLKLKELGAPAWEYWRFLLDRCGVDRVKVDSGKTDTGYTYSTPVSDGTHLYVKLHTGALAKVDLDGNIVWLVDHGIRGTSDCDRVPSPILIGDKVLLFGPVRSGKDSGKEKAEAKAEAEEELPDAPTGAMAVHQVIAFHAGTGNQLWTAQTRVAAKTLGDSWISGTPVPMRLSNANESLDVIVTANGAVIRVEDGKVLRSYVGSREMYGSPITDDLGTVIISGQAQKAAYELILVDRDTIGVKTRWFVSHPGVFQDANYGLVHQGKLWFSRPLLDVTDLATGRLEWMSGNIFFTQPGRGYPAPVLAGNLLYAADNSEWFQPTYRPKLLPFPGALSVVDATVPALVLARNQIELVKGSFICDGDRLYVRGLHSLMCYGYTGDAGRAWEAATVATEICSAVFPDPPAEGAVVAASVAAGAIGKKPSAQNPVLGPITSWFLVAPLSAGREAAAARILADPAWPGWNAETKPEPALEGGTLKSLTIRTMPEWAWPDTFRIRGRDGFKLGPHIGFNGLFGSHVELSRLLKPEAGSIALLATTLTTDMPRLARYDAGHAQVIRSWIGGAELQHNQCVQFPVGTTTLVVAVRLDDPGAPLILKPRFWPSLGNAKDRTEWIAFMQRAKPWLSNAAKLAGDTPAGRKAAAILTTIGR